VGSGCGDGDAVGDSAGDAVGASVGDAPGEAAGDPVAASVGEALGDGDGVGVAGRGVTDSTGPGVSSESQVYAALADPWKNIQPMSKTPAAAIAVKITVR
jgi:hypothetical protein